MPNSKQERSRYVALGLTAFVVFLSGATDNSADLRLGTHHAPFQQVVDVTVLDSKTGALLSDVEVRIAQLGLQSRTDSSGSARFRGVSPGAYSIECRRLGYRPSATSLRFAGTDTAKVIIFLVPTTTQLPEVTVLDSSTPVALREFEQRRRRGSGRYITQQQIDDTFGSDLDALLSKRLPGLRAGKTVRSRGCTVVAFLDGIHLFKDEVVDIDPIQLAGVEFYTMTTIPVQYRAQTVGGRLDCGVILFWSKTSRR